MFPVSRSIRAFHWFWENSPGLICPSWLSLHASRWRNNSRLVRKHGFFGEPKRDRTVRSYQTSEEFLVYLIYQRSPKLHHLFMVLWHSFHQRWAILGILWNAGAQGSRVRADPTVWSTSWADFELVHCVRVSHVAFGDVDVCGLPGGGGSEHQRWWHFHEDPRPANFPKNKELPSGYPLVI